MGMTPMEYDCITFSDLILKIEGYSDRRKDEMLRERLCAYFAYIAPHVQPKKGTRPQDLYPIGDEITESNKSPLSEKREALKEMLKSIDNV